ncbi:MAG: hypothetical protein U9Q96_00540 [Patescibacteria group bacterium]|nr:hypothetical protein [Patescibacteria group bacterium]
MKYKRHFLILVTTITLVSLFQPFVGGYFDVARKAPVSSTKELSIVRAQSTCSGVCQSECAYYGQKTCSGDTSYKICGNYNSDTCLEWSSPYSCGAGQVCEGGSCVTPAPVCQSECAYYGQKTCSDSTHYKACGNHDSDTCLEWSSARYCGIGKICQDGNCITECNPHDYKSCSNNDVYWYNSCNNRETKYQECGNDSWTSNYQCSGTVVQRQKTIKGCSGSSCYTNTEWVNEYDCAVDNKICEAGECISTCSDDCSYIGQIDKQCSSGHVEKRTCGNHDCDSCLEWSGWSDFEDCGNSDWSSDYQCSGSDLQRKWINRGCSNAACFTTPEWRIFENCGSDSWTSNYQCSGTIIQRQKHKQGCSGTSCYDYYQWENEYDCDIQGKICNGGECVDTDLQVSCNASPNPADIDETVNFYSNVSGGSGSYSYTWTNSCVGSSSNCSRTFSQPGAYSATVTVSSGGQTDSANCSVQINEAECQCSEWSSWQDQGCGQDGCDSSQMYQIKTRDCTPSSCAIESESRCIVDTSCQATCQDDCSYIGQTTCYDNNSKKTCGNYDSDSCLEWSSPQNCGNDTCIGSSWRNSYCSGGVCGYNDIQCHSNCYSCGDGICNSECGENQYNCSQDCGQSCQNECAYSGQLRCYNSTSRQICGNYDSDSCLEWSSAQSCTGSTSCGYGSCDSNERPNWSCSGGVCEYNCSYSSSCGGYDNDYRQCYNNDVYWYDSNNNRQSKDEECGSDYCNSWGSNFCSSGDVYKQRTCYDKGCSGSSCYNNSETERELVERCDGDEACDDGECVKDCECSTGPCCDGCHYKESDKVCNSYTKSEYGCPWGIGCGADVGKRTKIKFQYCSGDDSDCDGSWGSWRNWSSWTVNDYCSNTETCSVGDGTCNYSSSCAYTPVYNTKQCYDNDVYWFSQAGLRLSKYMECEDTNSCTQDGCDNSRCYNELKCNGSTCSKESADYCDSCEHCGDGIANCDEDFCSCPIDVHFPVAQRIAISGLVKEGEADADWQKNISINPDDEFSIMIVVASSGEETIYGVRVRNVLPDGLIYQGNLKVDGSPFVGNILADLNLGSLSQGQSKVVTFDVKAAASEEFVADNIYLNSISTVYYDDELISDSVGIEVVREIIGVAAAGTIFGQIVAVIGSLAFWLVMLFILFLAIILALVSYYFSRKKRAAQFA